MKSLLLAGLTVSLIIAEVISPQITTALVMGLFAVGFGDSVVADLIKGRLSRLCASMGLISACAGLACAGLLLTDPVRSYLGLAALIQAVSAMLFVLSEEKS